MPPPPLTLRLSCFVGTGLALLLSWSSVPIWVDYGVFVGLIVLTGIPHGATDHVIYRFLLPQQTEMRWGRFLGVYLGAMLGYGICWAVFPDFSLLFFLLISAYHFGQSQLLYVRLTEGSFGKTALYLLWGGWLLGSLLLLQGETVAEVLSAMFPGWIWVFMLPQEIKLWMIAGLTVALMVGLVVVWRQNSLDFGHFLQEIAVLWLLLVLFSLSSLWISFGVYFGLWHACSSIGMQVRGFQQEIPYSWPKFFREALPFSLVSFVGIALLLGLGQTLLLDQVSLPLLFFVAISTLTLPHIVYMQRFYTYTTMSHRTVPSRSSGRFTNQTKN